MANVAWGAKNQLKDAVQFVYWSVTFSDAGIATGVNVGTIPASSVITDSWAKVTAAFNAGTTNVLQVGKTGTLGAFMGTADINEASATAQRAVTALGTVGTSDVGVLVSYTQTGTAATTGAAHGVLSYINTAGTEGTP